MNKYYKPLMLIILSTGCAAPVFACNTCTISYFDYFLPPFLWWQFFPIIWFLAICIVRKKNDPHIKGIPRTVVGILICIGTFVLGNAFAFGPLLTLLLLIPCFIFTFTTLNKNIRAAWGPQQSKKYAAISIIGSISLVCLLGSSILIRINRTPGQYVVRWGINGAGRAIIDQLNNNPASDLHEIRFIVSKADPFASAKLAETLARRGDPAIDFPILLNALKRTRESLKYGEDDFESALRIITGLELPPNTTVQMWEISFKTKDKIDSSSKTDSAGAKSSASD